MSNSIYKQRRFESKMTKKKCDNCSLFVSEELLVGQTVFAVCKTLPLTPLYIFRDRPGLFLCQAGHQHDEEFTLAVQGVDILFFKINTDSCDFQFPDRIKGIYRITGKPGEGLCDNEVDLAVQGICNHSVKCFSAIQGGAGDTFVRIDACELPIRTFQNQFLKIVLLSLDATHLLIGIGGHPGIGRYTLLSGLQGQGGQM